jgi:hypothetical protein
MTAEQKITIQSEISLEQLYRIITQLPFEQRLTLADEIKHKIVSEQPQTIVSNPNRKPSSKIAGKGMILGDIISPIVPIEDWNVLA